MGDLLLALHAEMIKLRHSRIVLLSFLAFALAPVMLGLMVLIMKNPGALPSSSILVVKSSMLSFALTWPSFLGVLCQAMAIGGIVVFGFVAAWLFGREFSDGTAKDLLALPVSRAKILHAKFIIYVTWAVALAIADLLLGLLVGHLTGLPAAGADIIWQKIGQYAVTTLLVLMPGTVVAFIAMAGRDYLAPLGFVALTLLLAQVLVLIQMVASLGLGYYYPWSIPSLYSGAAGPFNPRELGLINYLVLVVTSVAGYAGTILWWKYGDQAR